MADKEQALKGAEQRELARPGEAEYTHSGEHYVPAVDILENDAELVLLADMPGVAPGDVEVDLEGGELSIFGRARERTLDRDFAVAVREHQPGHFARTFTLGQEIDAGRIEASMRGGVLRLRLPKSAAALTRRIKVAG